MSLWAPRGEGERLYRMAGSARSPDGELQRHLLIGCCVEKVVS